MYVCMYVLGTWDHCDCVVFKRKVVCTEVVIFITGKKTIFFQIKKMNEILNVWCWMILYLHKEEDQLIGYTLKVYSKWFFWIYSSHQFWKNRLINGKFVCTWISLLLCVHNLKTWKSQLHLFYFYFFSSSKKWLNEFKQRDLPSLNDYLSGVWMCVRAYVCVSVWRSRRLSPCGTTKWDKDTPHNHRPLS